MKADVNSGVQEHAVSDTVASWAWQLSALTNGITHITITHE